MQYATIQTILYIMFIYTVYVHHSSHITIDHKFLICILNCNMYFKNLVFCICALVHRLL